MKLTKLQIEALAESIVKEFEEKRGLEKNQLLEKQLEDFKPTFNKSQEIFKKYPEVQSVNISYIDRKIEIYRESKLLGFKNSWELKDIIKDKMKPRLTLGEVERAIILSTIDTKSVDEIIDKVKNKFK